MSQTTEIIAALLDWNPWLKGEFPEHLAGVSRDYQILSYLQIPEIKILEGARRVGKSTLLYQVIKEVISDGKMVLYINFDDDILREYTIEEIYYAFLEEYKLDYLFIDEIQQCSNWAGFIRKLYDRKEVGQIWITGSNASLMKNEYASLLTGRSLSIEIHPLSFGEFLRFKGEPLKGKTPSKAEETRIKKLFKEYVHYGSFPAVALRDVYQKEILINYFEDFIYKDIASRYDVNTGKIKELGVYLATNASKSFSFRKIASSLNLHPNTAAIYFNYLTEIFLFSEVYKFDYSLKKQYSHDKKVYALDTGMASAISFKFSEDTGRVLENIVYNDLIRRDGEIFFHSDKTECDFVIKNDLSISEAIQVTYRMDSDETRKREIAGLLEALQTYKLNDGLILTMDEEAQQDINIEGETKTIILQPIWKWLLEYRKSGNQN